MGLGFDPDKKWELDSYDLQNYMLIISSIRQEFPSIIPAIIPKWSRFITLIGN